MKVVTSYWLVCVVLWQYYSCNHAYYHKGVHPSKGQRQHSGLQHDAGGTTDNPFLREHSSVISTRKPDLHHRQHPHERDENLKGYPQKRHYEQWLKHGAVGYKQSPSLSQSIPKVQAQKANIGDASSLALNRDDLSDPYQHQYMMDGSASSNATTPPTSSVGINQDETLIALTNNGNSEQQQSASTLPLQLHQDNINQTQHHINAELLHHNKGKKTTHSGKPHSRPVAGRHVCTHEERVTKPVRVVESYCKPAYKSFTQRCANGTTCTAFRVQYDTIYRTVIKYQTSTEKRQTCCPGWTTSAKHAHGCLQPLCAQGCKHGGTCIKPDLCQCPLGYTGPTCETDVDECAGDHKCQQVCINTFGSYKCNCHDGFELQRDGRTCKFRIESVPELMAILEKLENLEKKQQEALAVAPTLPSVSTPPSPPVIEFNTTWIEEKLNRLEAQLNELSDRMDKVESEKATAANSNNVDSAFSIASLSDQLGVLEERLAECKCGPSPN